jgi:proteic killer suppression protein
VDILFGSEELERTCTDGSFARKRFGLAVAKYLARRLDALRAAPRLSDFVQGKPHLLKGDFAGCYGIWLDGGFRLVVRPANDPVPLLADGGIDRANVTIVSIEYVGNYHD